MYKLIVKNKIPSFSKKAVAGGFHYISNNQIPFTVMKHHDDRRGKGWLVNIPSHSITKFFKRQEECKFFAKSYFENLEVLSST